MTRSSLWRPTIDHILAPVKDIYAHCPWFPNNFWQHRSDEVWVTEVHRPHPGRYFQVGQLGPAKTDRCGRLWNDQQWNWRIRIGREPLHNNEQYQWRIRTWAHGTWRGRQIHRQIVGCHFQGNQCIYWNRRAGCSEYRPQSRFSVWRWKTSSCVSHVQAQIYQPSQGWAHHQPAHVQAWYPQREIRRHRSDILCSICDVHV